MSFSSIITHFPLLLRLILSVVIFASSPIYSLESGDAVGRSFDLFGDAHFVDGGPTVHLTRPMPSSSGLALYRKPFRFTAPTSVGFSPTSFSTDFTFSISSHNGDGIAFLVVPSDFPSKFSGKSPFGIYGEDRLLRIEFNTLMDGNAGEVNTSEVGIDVGGHVSVKIGNLSSAIPVLDSGKKLHSWIDYDATSKRLEVWLSEFGGKRPFDPMLTHQMDLSKIWKSEEVLAGISSSSGNDHQTSSLHSWRFEVRNAPKWLHSQPVNLQQVESNRRKKKSCLLRLISGLIFLAGCGVLVAFIVLPLWAIVVGRGDVTEKSKLPTQFSSERVNLTLDDDSTGHMKNFRDL